MNRPGDHEVYEGEDAAIASAFKKSIVVIFSPVSYTHLTLPTKA